MFTGIVEGQGEVFALERQGSNTIFWLSCPFADELQVDESLNHDGVCLTVDARTQGRYRVTAIEETLARTNLGAWRPGWQPNLERSMPANGRFGGHMVQGHVDAPGTLLSVDDRGGSWLLRFGFAPQYQALLVDKGSICINGVSLTVVEAGADAFSVAIIPYTWQHTNLGRLAGGDAVNLEFDIVGKYILKSRGLFGGAETSPDGWKDIE